MAKIPDRLQRMLDTMLSDAFIKKVFDWIEGESKDRYKEKKALPRTILIDMIEELPDKRASQKLLERLNTARGPLTRKGPFTEDEIIAGFCRILDEFPNVADRQRQFIRLGRMSGKDFWARVDYYNVQHPIQRSVGEAVQVVKHRIGAAFAPSGKAAKKLREMTAELNSVWQPKPPAETWWQKIWRYFF